MWCILCRTGTNQNNEIKDLNLLVCILTEKKVVLKPDQNETSFWF